MPLTPNELLAQHQGQQINEEALLWVSVVSKNGQCLSVSRGDG